MLSRAHTLSHPHTSPRLGPPSRLPPVSCSLSLSCHPFPSCVLPLSPSPALTLPLSVRCPVLTKHVVLSAYARLCNVQYFPASSAMQRPVLT
eukprot:223615-Rhodomonas_salina.2